MADRTTIHVYVSTYCQHDQHDRCRLHCKICEAPCRCLCHDATPSGGRSDG